MPSKVTKSAMAGSVAGFVEAACMHPADVIKTRVQARTYGRDGILRAVHSAFFQEGFFALYKGLTPTVVCVVPRVTLQMTGLAFFKPRFQGVVPDALVPTMAGVCTGALQAVLFVTPLEAVKVRQQTQRGFGGKYDSMMKTTSLICREEGFRSLYQGLTACTVRQVWGLTVKFSGYEGVKALFMQYERSRVPPGQEPQLAGWQHAVAGGATNVAVGVLVSPPDVVKTRLQDQHSSTAARYTSTFDCVRTMYRSEGLLSFFRGSTLRILRVAPGGAIQFGVYGMITDWLDANW